MSESKTLILHVGAGKTGSTSIQKALIKNEEILKRKGIKYLGMMLENARNIITDWQLKDGWINFVNYEKHQRNKELLSILTKEFESNEISTFVWSNEAFFNKPELFSDFLFELIDQTPSLDVKIIGYLRNHESWLFSAYIQWSLKHKTYNGPVKSFREWYAPEKADFSSVVERWQNEVFSTVFKSYDTLSDVVDDFMTFIGVDSEEYTKLTRENQRANNVAIMLWAMFNNLHEDPSHPEKLQNLLQSNDVIYSSIPDFDIDSLMLTEEDLQSIKGDCLRDREKLNRLLDEKNQSPIPNSAVSIPDLTVSKDQVLSVMLKMLNNQSDKIDTLKDRVEKLESIVLGGSFNEN